jgi:membrane-bound ClpP family serine protease
MNIPGLDAVLELSVSTAVASAGKVCFIKIDDTIGPATAGAISRSVDKAKTQRTQRLSVEVGKG